MLRPVLSATLCLACASVFAQNQSQKSPESAPARDELLQNQEQTRPAREGRKVERIHTEDSRATIDETRLGGETQAITVQPRNAGLPAYEVLPKSGARSSPGNAPEGAGGQGPRVWKFLDF